MPGAAVPEGTGSRSHAPMAPEETRRGLCKPAAAATKQPGSSPRAPAAVAPQEPRRGPRKPAAAVTKWPRSGLRVPVASEETRRGLCEPEAARPNSPGTARVHQRQGSQRSPVEAHVGEPCAHLQWSQREQACSQQLTGIPAKRTTTRDRPKGHCWRTAAGQGAAITEERTWHACHSPQGSAVL